MVFCTHCHSKIRNNFKDWKTFNPDASFEDFKNQVCFSEEQMRATQNIKPSKKKLDLKTLAGIIAGIVFFILFSQLGRIAYEHFNTPEFVTADLLEKSAERKEFGKLGLSIISPFELKENNLEMPEAVKPYINEMYFYSVDEKEPMGLMVNSIKYDDSVGQIDLNGAALGSVNEMKNTEGTTDFTYDKQDIVRQGLVGFDIRGSFTRNNTKAHFINLGLMDGFKMYQLVLIYKVDDKLAEKLALKIFNSLEIRKTD